MIDHGTLSMYQYYRCRCEACKAANADYGRMNRERLKSRRVPDRVHGTLNGYRNWGCRCELCAAVQAESNATTYQTRKEAA